MVREKRPDHVPPLRARRRTDRTWRSLHGAELHGTGKTPGPRSSAAWPCEDDLNLAFTPRSRAPWYGKNARTTYPLCVHVAVPIEPGVHSTEQSSMVRGKRPDHV